MYIRGKFIYSKHNLPQKIIFGHTEFEKPYIDEGKIRWKLDESMLEIPAQSSLDIVPPQPTGVVSVKSALKIKKKVE